MTTELGNLGRKDINTGQLSNQGEIDSAQPPQGEGGDGSKLTEAELMNQELSPVWSELRELLRKLRNLIIETAEEYLKPTNTNISDSDRKSLKDELALLYTVSINPEGTEELEIMIKIALQYIQRLEIDYDRRKQLVNSVVKIAINLREAVYKIVYKQEFSYETKIDFLKGFISFMVNLISNFPLEFRGRKSGKYIDYPNNVLLEVLDNAAYALLEVAKKRAEELNNPQKLINTISRLLEMTKELWTDELRAIYSKILVLTSFMINELVMKNGDIDGLMKQLIIDWCINYFAKNEDTFDQFVNQLLNWIPPHLGLRETLSETLSKLASKTGNKKYSDMASRLNRNTKLERSIEELKGEIARLKGEIARLKGEIAELEGKNAELEGKNAELEGKNKELAEKNVALEGRIAELKRIVQRLLEQIGSQTNEEE
jgi:cell division protein FtsB